MQKAEKRLLAILRRAKAVGISTEIISKEISSLSSDSKVENNKKYVYYSIIIVLCGVLLAIGSYWMSMKDLECLIEMPFDGSKVFRKPEDCNMCKNVNKVDRVTNISHDDFDDLYASRVRPLIVTDGTRGWSAKELFDFQFFKDLYTAHDSKMTYKAKSKIARSECQFFPYKTEFESLQDVLNMSPERSRLENGTRPWYIGWSNCNDAAGKILRRHYKRPYFLPPISENMALSWIFMGGPGEGAHMHVDNVRYPSWQAQLRGRKKWRLAPPPECYYTCQEFEAIVEPGEIIVVDTNRWYHQTHILPGDISITIGTEFD